ncbi:PREDICTED: echinoderm microtubule-associated protein-like CG42247 [Ceratosolen solmsi marchali]|uniref:Echinoderm microtubule-associated protein-like CG42247 n=1 Tax=Ceratosolen solmsi marchali TaxID=326594 RepID=A0AAJ6YFN4_9HYME|nr:PREDICTED: echinoderm microtubule-associated protein-like CG42247 [Ceratosolen solmsi marchali]
MLGVAVEGQELAAPTQPGTSPETAERQREAKPDMATSLVAASPRRQIPSTQSPRMMRRGRDEEHEEEEEEEAYEKVKEGEEEAEEAVVVEDDDKEEGDEGVNDDDDHGRGRRRRERPRKRGRIRKVGEVRAEGEAVAAVKTAVAVVASGALTEELEGKASTPGNGRRPAAGEGAAGLAGMGGYWSTRQSRPSSPRMPPPEQPPLQQEQAASSCRPRSRHEHQQPAQPPSRYNNLGYWRARRVTFYRNGDPYFPGVEFRFKPGRDIGSLEALLDRLSLRLDLPRGARHIFSMDGDRKLNLDELEDGASYVVSSYKTFKHDHGRNYKDYVGRDNDHDDVRFRKEADKKRLLDCPREHYEYTREAFVVLMSDSFEVISLPADMMQPASYGKKSNTWYTSSGVGGGGGGGGGAARSGGGLAGGAMPGGGGMGGWQSRSTPAGARKASITDEAPPPGGGKPSSGRVIRIVNNLDHTVQCRVLLNLRTSQPFEEVLEDLGQVLKMNGAKRMFTVSGQEVRSFSQLRNEFADVDTFYLGTGAGSSGIATAIGSPARRSRSRGPPAVVEDIGRQRRARSKSRPRALYAPDSEVVRVNDYSVVEVLREEPARVTIRGLRRSFYPPSHLPPVDNSPPDKKLSLEWVYGYRGTDTRRNLWVLPSGELLYYVAAVAVLYDREENAQRHYIGHTEDITCMEVHPSRELVASGQRAGRHRKAQPHVRIWSTETLLTLYVFGMTEFQMGVSALAFSQLNGGSYVLVVDAGRESILSVWQWQWGHLLGKVATLQEDLTGAAFHPLDDNLLITHGKGHLTFWNRRKDGFFERTDIIKPD